MPTSQYHGYIFLVKVPSSQVTLVYIKLTKQMLTPHPQSVWTILGNEQSLGGVGIRRWEEGRSQADREDRCRWEGALKEVGSSQERALHKAGEGSGPGCCALRPHDQLGASWSTSPAAPSGLTRDFLQ